MYASQYEVTLPADYDMEIIRERIASAAHVLDDRAGLGLKAYVLRERGVDGSPINQYAPFYLWNDPAAMAQFIVGGSGFERIIRSFGRVAVQHWTGVATMAGPARATAPRAASRLLISLPADPDADDTGLGTATMVQQAIDELAVVSRRSDVHTAALAVDPLNWQLVTFVLWADAVAADANVTERYEVLHTSTPGLAELPNGRHW